MWARLLRHILADLRAKRQSKLFDHVTNQDADIEGDLYRFRFSDDYVRLHFRYDR